jgi:hypothetical protein
LAIGMIFFPKQNIDHNLKRNNTVLSSSEFDMKHIAKKGGFLVYQAINNKKFFQTPQI